MRRRTVNPNRFLSNAAVLICLRVPWTPRAMPELRQNGTVKVTFLVGRGHGGGTVGIRRGKGGVTVPYRGRSSVPFWHITRSSRAMSISHRWPNLPTAFDPRSGLGANRSPAKRRVLAYHPRSVSGIVALQ